MIIDCQRTRHAPLGKKGEELSIRGSRERVKTNSPISLFFKSAVKLGQFYKEDPGLIPKSFQAKIAGTPSPSVAWGKVYRDKDKDGNNNYKGRTGHL